MTSLDITPQEKERYKNLRERELSGRLNDEQRKELEQLKSKLLGGK